MIKTICVVALGAVVVGCHLDKLLGGSGGGSPPPSHGTPAGLAFTTQPRTAQAGQPIGPVRVSVVDSAGRPVAGVDTTTVFVTLGTNPGGAKLHGDTSTHPLNGVATFTNLSLDNAGHGYTLKASAAGLTQPSDSFDIMAPPPTTGTLTVTTNTPANAPAAGYTVAVSGATSQPIGASATATFVGLSAGDHTVTLGDVPSNCTVTGGNSQTVTITANQTTPATFTIVCTPPPPTTGTIAVTTATSGPSQPSGYTVALDGGASQPIPATGSASFTDVSPGMHSVALGGVPSNCAVAGGNTQTISVTANQTTPLAFTITCTATTGSITVTTNTTGTNPPSGYNVTVDAGPTQSVAASGTVRFDGLSVANHSVGLSPIPSNCSVSGPNPQTVAVTAGDITPASFSISCTAPPPPPQATHAVFTSQPPSSVLLGASFGATVTAYDDQGNVATNFTGTVTMSIASSTGIGGSLSGTTQVNAVNGVATFTDLHINAVIGTYTLRAHADGLRDATSNSILVGLGL